MPVNLFRGNRFGNLAQHREIRLGQRDQALRLSHRLEHDEMPQPFQQGLHDAAGFVAFHL